MKGIISAFFILLLIYGCASEVYQSQRSATNWKDNEKTDYKTISTDQFTLTYPDEWIEPRHYTQDYYYFQLMEVYPYLIHLSVFDIEEFTNTTDYYETMSELFYMVFDFQEIEHYVDEEVMVIRGTMVDEEDDTIVTYKVIVCQDIVLALDVSGLTEEYSETKEMIDNTVKSFKCN